MIRNRIGLATAMALLLAALSLAGCSSYQSFRKAEIAAAEGNWDEAVLHYKDASEREPDNLAYRSSLLRTKMRASQEHFKKGKQFRDAGVPRRALMEFQQAIQLDPTNQYAQAELEAVFQQLRAEQENRNPEETIDDLKKRTRGARPQPPVLNPKSDEPIDMDFPKPTSVKDIYRALGKAFGINVLFDTNLKDQEITITLKEVTAQSALEVVMRAAGHFYKVQDEHTIIVVADTPQNRRNYEDLVIQTFFLSNADIKQVMTMLRSLVDAKKIATNEQLNAIILRDTADKVKVAEKIIESNDKAKAEVVVDVELLQVNSTRLQELGLELSTNSITQSLDLGGENIPLRLSDLDDLTTNNWSLTIPDFLYNFVKTSTQSQILARPQLRITEGEKARLLIGDRVPIPTTTFNTSNTVGGNIVPLTTFQYTDVGIKIELEPRVHHNKEITLKVTVEVSNISDFVEAAGGQRQPVIGTRTIESTIRLKDGETNFLAGLIRTEDINSETGIPGISDVPLLGRLFSNNTTNNGRTDVILTMTPHIIRTPNITEEDLLPIWVGTEANITFRGGSPRVESDVDGPFDGDDDRERVQELLRRRLQRLPRGLREEGSGEAEESKEDEGQPGTSLAPSSGPGSFFDQDQAEPEPPSPFDEQEENVSSLVLPLAPETATAVALSLDSPEPQSARARHSPVELSLVSSQPAVGLGDSLVVEVRASSATPVSHLPLELRFDPALFDVDQVLGGDFLGKKGEATVLSDASRPGIVAFGASRLGDRDGVTGSGLLATVVLKAKTVGVGTLSLQRVNAMNENLEPVASAVGAALTVTVTKSTEGQGPGGRGPRRHQDEVP
jgi:general secretion pathway protein D